MSNIKTDPTDPINVIVETTTDPYGGSRMECIRGGLTKREYFAAMSMQGFLANTENSYRSLKSIANSSVEIAEELIKALNNEQQ